MKTAQPIENCNICISYQYFWYTAEVERHTNLIELRFVAKIEERLTKDTHYFIPQLRSSLGSRFTDAAMRLKGRFDH
jgi:hypothetical protein